MQFEDFHGACSVLVGRLRNVSCLAGLPPSFQFRWTHRFYLVLDAVVKRHKVYKLYGGAHGFMITTGVAEPDPDHATTLLRCAMHLQRALEPIRVPGEPSPEPLDLVMALASGPAASGLLGSMSLTYQVVGRPASAARELAATQQSVPFLVAASMFRELQPDMAARLVPLGSVPLQCCPGEAAEELYSQPQFSDMSLTQPRTSPAAEASAAAPPGKAGLAAARSYAASLKAVSAALACMLSSAIGADT